MKTSTIISIISVLAAACAPDDEAAPADAGAPPPRDAGCPTLHEDRDGDGHGNPKVSQTSCSPIQGWVQSSDDCDDASKYANPLEREVCDGIDNDCSAATTDASRCPDGCQPTVDPRTGKAYLFCSEAAQQTWVVASAVCATHEFHLVQIDSAAENEFVHRTVTTRIGPVASVWLGGADSKEGVWSWESGAQFWHGLGASLVPAGFAVPTVYNNWPADGKEPNNEAKAPGENCLAQRRSADTALAGQWNDRECSAALAFVCERD